ncbi:MAG TPA: alpha/beta hydrolase [Candidatus Binataceae bacterium]|jgi:pimeloyl-ACP methyl ester carboxylesterase|nr:alpha/beta hydrolase [Candidatus Binataceae bacterium]
MADTKEWTEEKVRVGETDLVVVKGGKGKPLLILHGELGWAGWMSWNAALAKERTLLIPMHPGFGKTAMAEWISNIRDLAGFYQRYLREQGLAPIDVMGFSLGGWVAAEMAACDSRQFRKMILVAPTGIRPPQGEIMDMFTVTARTYLTRSAFDPHAAPEFAKLFGGEQTPEQFEAWEDARAESARLAWEPYMFNPSLPHLLEGIEGLPTLLLWGKQDPVVPLSAGEAYQRAIKGSKLVTIDKCGHWPTVEQPAQFLKHVEGFLS